VSLPIAGGLIAHISDDGGGICGRSNSCETRHNGSQQELSTHTSFLIFPFSLYRVGTIAQRHLVFGGKALFRLVTSEPISVPCTMGRLELKLVDDHVETDEDGRGWMAGMIPSAPDACSPRVVRAPAFTHLVRFDWIEGIPQAKSRPPTALRSLKTSCVFS
jgi:hypothetical protein